MHIKTFENFKDIENNYNHFDGIDISDLYSFDFFWSNKAFISDYKKQNGEYGSANKRIMLDESLDKYLTNKVTKEKFKEILKEEGFIINRDQIDGSYSFRIEGKPHHFFDIIKNLKYLL